MPDNRVLMATQGSAEALDHFAPKVALRMRLHYIEGGQYVLLGKVSILNFDGDAQNAFAELTTDDGATVLDRTDIRLAGATGDIDPGRQGVPLQGHLMPGSSTIVDLRCGTFNGEALQGSVVAIPVDVVEYADF